MTNAEIKDVIPEIKDVIPEWTRQLNGTAWEAVLDNAYRWAKAALRGLGESLDDYTNNNIKRFKTHSEALKNVKDHIFELREYISDLERYLRLSSEQIKQEIWNETK